jgi:hypothetical protein
MSDNLDCYCATCPYGERPLTNPQTDSPFRIGTTLTCTIDQFTGFGCVHHPNFPKLQAEVERLSKELSDVRGAMAADDERLAKASARVGIVAGCDAPDEMADEIIFLRAGRVKCS